MNRLNLIVLSLLMLLLPLSAKAHRLKVFAQADGALVRGQVYFVGGAKAINAAVRIKISDGQLLAELRTDAEGRFSYQLSRPDDLLIEADSGDGHEASWPIKAQELAPAFAGLDQGKAPAEAQQPASSAASHSGTQVAGDVQTPSMAELELAIARQIAPLREELSAAGDERRLQDIIGGLGYIFGLAGLALWWKSRR